MSNLEFHQIVREIINGAWFFLGAWLVFVFGSNVLRRYKYHGFVWSKWRDDPVSQASIALATLALGEAMMRGWSWAVIYSQNKIDTTGDVEYGEWYIWIRDGWEFAIFACFVAIAGALCCVRVFSPQYRAVWMQVIAAFLAFSIPLMLHFITHDYF